MGLSMSTIPEAYSVYGFNFNATDPKPPGLLDGGTSIPALWYLNFLFYVIGFACSSFLLLVLSNDPQSSTRHRGVLMTTRWDCFFCIVLLATWTNNLVYGRVSSWELCQITGWINPAVGCCEISTISALAVDRYKRLELMQDQNSHSRRFLHFTKPGHWKFVEYCLWPFIFVLFSLPFLTSGSVGASGLHPNGAHCIPVGGRGIIEHDLLCLATTMLHAIAVAVFSFYMYKSHVLVKDLLNVDSSNVGAKKERRALHSAIVLTAVFLSMYGLVAILFIAMGLGFDAYSWDARYFDVAGAILAIGMATNPFIHVYFDEGLKARVLATVYQCRQKLTGSRAGSTMPSSLSKKLLRDSLKSRLASYEGKQFDNANNNAQVAPSLDAISEESSEHSTESAAQPLTRISRADHNALAKKSKTLAEKLIRACTENVIQDEWSIFLCENVAEFGSVSVDFLDRLIAGVLCHHLVDCAPSTASNSSPEVVSEDDVYLIGTSLMIFVASERDSIDGIKKWIKFYPLLSSAAFEGISLPHFLSPILYYLDYESRFVLHKLGISGAVPPQPLEFVFTPEGEEKDYMLLMAHVQPEMHMERRLEMAKYIAAAYTVGSLVIMIPGGSGFNGGLWNDTNWKFLFLVFPLQPLTATSAPVCMALMYFNAPVFMRRFISTIEEKRLFLRHCAVNSCRVVIISYIVSFLPLPVSIVYPFPWFYSIGPIIVIPLVTVFVKRSIDKIGEHIIGYTSQQIKLVIVHAFVIFGTLVFLPFLPAFYESGTTTLHQLKIIGAFSIYRVALTSWHEWACIGVMSDVFVVYFTFIIDASFETSFILLGGSATSIWSLIVPPFFDLMGNIGAICYIYYFVKGRRQATILIASLTLREVVEVSTKIGITVAYATVWLTRRTEFYMIDVVPAEKLVRTITVTIITSVLECVFMYFVSRLIWAKWRISVLQFASNVMFSTGIYYWVLPLLADITYFLAFLQYDLGSDYFMNFAWVLHSEELSGGTWCEELQNIGKSCYSLEIMEELRSLGYNITTGTDNK
jgi:hypothetical protein